MGQIGRWIDSLTDEQRDRIIEHPDPTFIGLMWWDDGRNCGCLVGSVYGPRTVEMYWNSTIPGAADKAGVRFPILTRRFTPERMWRVCKARAARRNAVNVAPVAETADVA